MATMNVSLSQEFVDFVNREIASGEYGSASEVVRDALRMLRREKAARQEKLLILQREIGRGLDQARAGRFSDRTVAEIAAELDNENGEAPG
jgi:antitoxin ParD1/3/4